MSRYLYITADEVGIQTGGGSVTQHESQALKELGPTDVVDRKALEPVTNMVDVHDPWQWDPVVVAVLKTNPNQSFKLAHGYAGTFTETVRRLKDNGCKVTWTCAAHDVDKSREAHLNLGLPFDYPHLNDPKLFERYIGGYKLADVLITPSKHSHDVLRRQGCTNRIEIIPHGCKIPKCVKCDGTKISYHDFGGGELFESSKPCSRCKGIGYENPKPLPKQFTVGYLGAIGADKGLIYLIQAWAKLKYKDARLIIAGRDSTHPAVRYLVQQAGAGNVHLAGWQENVSDFYDSISLYVQPSVTEGWGIEVGEAMAHGRPVICSDGVGAVDMVPGWYCCPAGDVDALADKIETVRNRSGCVGEGYPDWRGIAEQYSWDKIRERYKNLWKELLE
jgi:glycosyltransferase involved in cell wall biosynthesis